MAEAVLEHITQAEIDAFLAQPVTPADIAQADHNLSELPAPRLAEVCEDYSDEIKTAGKKAVAVVAVAAELFGGVYGKPSTETHQTPPSIVAQAKTATATATQNQHTATVVSGEEPMTDAEIDKLYDSNLYTKAMANAEGPAAVLPVEALPENFTVGQATIIAVKSNPKLDPKEFAEGLPITNPQLIPKAKKGEDIYAQPIKHEEGEVLVMAGAMASSMGQFKEDLKKADEAAKATEAQKAAEIVATPDQNSPELAWIKETSVQGLTKAILDSPNIRIAPSPGDQVLKSLQHSAETGKTFSYNLGHESEQDTVISPKLMQMILYLANVKGHKIVISAVTTGNHTSTSLHWPGLAMDIYPEKADNRNGNVNFKNPEVIAAFQALDKDTYDVREVFGIDELIYKYPATGTTRLKHGQDATNVYSQEVLDNHEDHEHVDVNGHDAVDPEAIYNLVFALTPEKAAIIDSLPIEQWKKDNLKVLVPIIMRYSTTNKTVTLAQWWIESNAGKDCPGNNCFGMKPDGYWDGETQTFMTFEYYNGVRKNEEHVFKKYPSLQAGIMDHDALINRAPHYRDAIAAKNDWRAYLHALVNPGEPAYATAPNYEQVLSDLILSTHLEELTR